jgi:hypothetical protein
VTDLEYSRREGMERREEEGKEWKWKWHSRTALERARTRGCVHCLPIDPAQLAARNDVSSTPQYSTAIGRELTKANATRQIHIVSGLVACNKSNHGLNACAIYKEIAVILAGTLLHISPSFSTSIHLKYICDAAWHSYVDLLHSIIRTIYTEHSHLEST